jgi:hypothetical protein
MYDSVIWGPEDDPHGNVQHIATNGLTKEDVEHGLEHTFDFDVSARSGLPLIYGVGPHGRDIIVVLRTDRRLNDLPDHSFLPEASGGEMTIRRIQRDRPPTKAEAERYRALRRQAEAEKPLILQQANASAAIRDLLAELRTAREQRGLSLADVREKTGMDRSGISKLESGARDNPTLATLIRYADAVGKSLVVRLVDK